ncbi:3-oxo-isoapionate kinase OiaK [Caldimonas tepidiphila]|uniref:3-oxo-isoapionate kinase OiaK n=1 Tax=Caldimonas tepidiphila TaxID=2315841 RepID=UPI000E5A62DB|nr:3-oxo-isoapionate kinase OiaK [Caldimonas tepidiphila]
MAAAAAGARWPDGLLLSYYGDDFTGSTDVMEAFTAAGVPTVLFLRPPQPHWLQRFPGVRCVGLAGQSRGRSPEWMRRELPAALASLARLGAPLLQYKVCSTFDSSPEIGSIGQAIELGVPLMPGRWSPMLVGVPRLKRYQAFGNLFAAVDGVCHRLDRHPTMSRHPATPMREADLRLHLRAQTARRTELIDLVQLRAGADARVQALAGDDVPVTLIDVLDEETLAEAGRLVWELRGSGLFSASSSGLQYALAAHWRRIGLLPAEPSLPCAAPVEAIAAVSGSCSPVTAAQIRWAQDNGFHAERLRLAPLFDAAGREAEIGRALDAAAAALAQGRSALVYSALGPDDPAVTGFDATAREAGLSREDAMQQVGRGLAELMRRLLDRVPLRRVVVAGGDSSGEVASRLDIAALSVLAGLAPGAPLCRAWSEDPARDGLEIVLKGGQMGGAAFFGEVRAGRVDPAPAAAPPRPL